MHKVFVFVPAFGQSLTATTWMTTMALQGHFIAKGVGCGFSTLSFPDIAELRAMALTIWYDTMPDVSHLLFIDSDMGFPPDMVTDMLLHDEPIVGTIYRHRREPVTWVGSGGGGPTTERRANFIKVEGVGGGCTLIRRDVVTAMLAKMPEMVDTRLALHPAKDTLQAAGCTRLIRAFEKLDIPERGIVSEDLSFCIRAAQCGFQTWAAIGYEIHHVGPYDYAGCYLKFIEHAQAQMAAQQQAVPLAGAQQIAALPVTAGGTASAEAVQVIDAPVSAPEPLDPATPASSPAPDTPHLVAAE